MEKKETINGDISQAASEYVNGVKYPRNLTKVKLRQAFRAGAMFMKDYQSKTKNQ